MASNVCFFVRFRVASQPFTSGVRARSALGTPRPLRSNWAGAFVICGYLEPAIDGLPRTFSVSIRVEIGVMVRVKSCRKISRRGLLKRPEAVVTLRLTGEVDGAGAMTTTKKSSKADQNRAAEAGARNDAALVIRQDFWPDASSAREAVREAKKLIAKRRGIDF